MMMIMTYTMYTLIHLVNCGAKKDKRSKTHKICRGPEGKDEGSWYLNEYHLDNDDDGQVFRICQMFYNSKILNFVILPAKDT